MFYNMINKGVITLNFIHINIIKSYWNLDFIEQKRERQYSITISSDITIDEFEEELIKTIMMDKGDGLELNLYSIKNKHFVDVVLLLGDEDEYSIDYLIEFFKQFNEQPEIIFDTDYDTYDTYLYLKYAPEEFKDITEILKEHGFEAELISERRSTFERGAGDYFLAYLIGIASSKTSEALSKIKEKYNDYVRDVQVGSLNIKNLKQNVSNEMNVNYNHLNLISFKELESGTYEVHFRTRYDNYFVTTNSKGDISKLVRKELTQTRI